MVSAISATKLRHDLHQVLKKVDDATFKGELVILVNDRPRAVIANYNNYAELKYKLTRQKKQVK